MWVGMMGLTPQSFWESSPRELYAAIEGFMEFNGSHKDDKDKPMSSGRMKELMELYPD